MGSGIYLSQDGGKTFTKITHPGLPKSPYGKTDVAIAPSNGNRMYALIQTGADGVQGPEVGSAGLALAIGRRRHDVEERELGSPADRPRGLLHPHSRLAGRSRTSADRQQHAVAIARRREDLGSGGGGCGDCHDIWWDTTPGMAGHYIVTGDGGMGIFGSPANPTRQHERVAADRTDVSRDGRSAQSRTGSIPIVRTTAACASRATGRSCRTNVPSYAPPPPRRLRQRPGAAAADVVGGRRRRWRAAVRRAGRTARRKSMPSCESGLHVSGAEQPSIRVGHVLRRARRDVRRTQRTAPLGQPRGCTRSITIRSD